MCQLKASCITIFLRKQNTTSFSALDNSLYIHDSKMQFMVQTCIMLRSWMKNFTSGGDCGVGYKVFFT